MISFHRTDLWLLLKYEIAMITHEARDLCLSRLNDDDRYQLSELNDEMIRKLDEALGSRTSQRNGGGLRLHLDNSRPTSRGKARSVIANWWFVLSRGVSKKHFATVLFHEIRRTCRSHRRFRNRMDREMKPFSALRDVGLTSRRDAFLVSVSLIEGVAASL
jgi:hypothetical protein